MTWEWLTWRCFDDVRETFEVKGWGYYGMDSADGSEAMPLLARADGYCVSFFKRDPGTGECWFELRDTARRRIVFFQGTENMPTPEKAARLLADHGGPAREFASPADQSLYGLPVAPVMHLA